MFFFVQQVEGGHGGEYVQFVVGEGVRGGSGHPVCGQSVSGDGGRLRDAGLFRGCFRC